MNNNIVEILPNLWLSSQKYALDTKFIKSKNIKVVINCTKNIEFVDLPNIRKVRVAVDDSLKQQDINKLYSFLPDVLEIIDKHMEKQDPILIHCFAGKQRSATVIAAYLMKHTKITCMESVVFIQSKKDNAFRPGINFKNALDLYYQDIN